MIAWEIEKYNKKSESSESNIPLSGKPKIVHVRYFMFSCVVDLKHKD